MIFIFNWLRILEFTMEMIEYGIHIKQDRSWVHDGFNFYRILSLFNPTIFQRKRGKSLIIKEQKGIEMAPRSISGASLVTRMVMHTDFSRGRSGSLVFPSLSEFSSLL